MLHHVARGRSSVTMNAHNYLSQFLLESRAGGGGFPVVRALFAAYMRLVCVLRVLCRVLFLESKDSIQTMHACISTAAAAVIPTQHNEQTHHHLKFPLEALFCFLIR